MARCELWWYDSIFMSKRTSEGAGEELVIREGTRRNIDNVRAPMRSQSEGS